MSEFIVNGARSGAKPLGARRQRGYSLIELSVAILIALFLIGGVLIAEQGVHRTYLDNSGIGQLQDEERFAMSLLTEVVQRAGYYPDPVNNTILTALPAENTTTPQGAAAPLQTGQYLFGINSGGTPQDSIFVRYMTASGQSIGFCDGTTNTSGAAHTYTNYLYLSSDSSGYYLNCELETDTAWAASPQKIVTGITNMQILYGVHTTGSGADADTYMTATDVTAGTYWPDVTAVKIKLTFVNPLYKKDPGQSQYVYFTRVISIMSRVGAHT